jgi:Collagen triple helix repeat (20 copies)
MGRERIANLRGLQGKDGKDGTNGRDGIDGIDGVDGVDGVDGEDGKDGLDSTVPGPGINVILVPASSWPPPADANPLNFYLRVAT